MTDRLEIPSDEHILLQVRQHWITLALRVVPPVVLALTTVTILLLVLSVDPNSPSTKLVHGVIQAFIVAPLMLALWITVVLTWTNHYLTTLTVTDQHIYVAELRGLFSRHISTISMENIQEIDVSHRNAWETFFSFGTITLQTAAPTEVDTTFHNIPNPAAVRTAIMDQINHFKQLTEANEQQEKLLHSISHEVKGHLAKSEAAFASIVQGDFGTVPDDLKKVAGSALADARTGVHTVMDILDASNFKKGTLTFSMKPFDIGAAALAVINDLRPAAEQKGLAFEYTVDGGTHMVVGDEQKLRQHVLRNLVDNAIRYTKTGSIKIELFHNAKVVQFSVADTGVGITTEDMTHLFTEGGKGHDSTAVNPASTGYGLFVAREMVEAHGGRIWAESKGAGQGSRFYVQFPATAV